MRAEIFKNIAALILTLAAAYFVGATLLPYSLYEFVFPPSFEGGFFGGEDIGRAFASFLIAYVFFIPLFFTVFDTKYKYWTAAILLLPALWVVAQTDPARLWFDVLVGVAGWIVGLSIAKILPFLKKENT